MATSSNFNDQDPDDSSLLEGEPLFIDDRPYENEQKNLLKSFYAWKESILKQEIHSVPVSCSNEDQSVFSYTDLTRENLVDVQILKNTTKMVHKGKYFICRLFVEPFRDESLFCMLEDMEGDILVGVILTNLPSFSFTIGTILCVKNPCYTRDINDCYVINFNDVVILNEAELHWQIPDITAWILTETNIEEPSSFKGLLDEQLFDILRTGDCFFNDGRYGYALEEYNYGLAISPENPFFLIQRSMCYFEIRRFQLALDDARVVLAQFPNDTTSVGRVIFSMTELGRYEEARDLLRSKLDEQRNEELETLLRGMENLIRQRDYGLYNMKILYASIGTDNQLKISDYTGPVEIIDVGSKGRGVVLTKDVAPGTLLLSCQALISVSLPKSDLDTALTILTNGLAKQIENHPAIGKAVYELSAGKEMGYLDSNKDDCSIVDYERLRRIVLINASETYLKDDARFYGLWIWPSYINHDCYDVNCLVSLFGNVRQIRSSKKLKKGDEIFISYREIGDSLASRTTAAYWQDFICKCRLCLYEAKEPKDIREKREKILHNFSETPYRTASKIKKLIKEIKQLSRNSPFADQYLYAPLLYLGGIYYNSFNFHEAIKMYSEFLAKWDRSGGDVPAYLVRAVVCGFVSFMNLDDMENATTWKRLVGNHAQMVYGCKDDDFLDIVSPGIASHFSNLYARINEILSNAISNIIDEDADEILDTETEEKRKKRKGKKSRSKKTIEEHAELEGKHDVIGKPTVKESKKQMDVKNEYIYPMDVKQYSVNQGTSHLAVEKESVNHETSHLAAEEDFANQETCHLAAKEESANQLETSPPATEEESTNQETCHLTDEEESSNQLETSHLAAEEESTNQLETSHLADEEEASNQLETSHLAAEEESANQLETSHLAAEEEIAKQETCHLAAKEESSNQSETSHLAVEEESSNQLEASHLAIEEESSNQSETNHLAAVEEVTNQLETSHLAAEEESSNQLETSHLAAEEEFTNQLEASHLAAEEESWNQLETSHLAAEEESSNQLETSHLAAEEEFTNQLEASHLAAEEESVYQLEARHLAAEEESSNQLGTSHLAAEEEFTNQLEASHLAAEEESSNQLETRYLAAEEESVYQLEARHLAAEEELANQETSHLAVEEESENQEAYSETISKKSARQVTEVAESPRVTNETAKNIAGTENGMEIVPCQSVISTKQVSSEAINPVAQNGEAAISQNGICNGEAEESAVIKIFEKVLECASNANARKNKIISQPELVALLRKQANASFLMNQYLVAATLFSNALELEPTDEELLVNRAICYLRLENFKFALEDTLACLRLNPYHVKALYRCVKAYIGLKAYDKAVVLLESTITVPKNKELTKLLWLAKELHAQKAYGHYDLKKFYSLFGLSHFHNIADYVGPVEMKNVGVKGRGVVATRDVEPGELLICCQAFACHFVPKSSSLIIKAEENVNHLATLIIDKIAKNREHANDLYQLWAGSELGYLDPAKDNCEVIDIQRIREIIRLNASNEELVDAQRFSLFTLTSYINNDCYDTNCTLLHFGNVCQVRNFKPLKKGQEIFTQYSFYRGARFRNFECKCEMCLYESREPTETVLRRQDLMLTVLDKQFKNAEELRDTITELKSLSNQDSPYKDYYVASALFELGNIYYEQNDYSKVIEVYHELLIDWERFGGDFGRIFAAACQQMLTLYYNRNESKKSLKWKKEFEAHVRRAFGTNDMVYISTIAPGYSTLDKILGS